MFMSQCECGVEMDDDSTFCSNECKEKWLDDHEAGAEAEMQGEYSEE